MTLVDIADEVRVRGALHLHALEFPILNARHARFLGYDIHENLLHRFLLSSPLDQRKNWQFPVCLAPSILRPLSCAVGTKTPLTSPSERISPPRRHAAGI